MRISQPKGDAAVLIPARAVRTEQDISRVFVIKDGRVQERVVQLGQVEGELVEVKTGISADELVATSNVEQLKDGAAVRQ